MFKTYFNWSSGKDAALALYHLQNDKNYKVDKLIVSVNADHNRVSMHGLRRELLKKQVLSIGLPVETIELSSTSDIENYNNEMKRSFQKIISDGYTHTGFGDIFLEDLRAYRENQLQPFNIKCCFPLWNRNTKDVLKEFMTLGFKAIVICINAELLDVSFAGRIIDEDFINDLPPNVDPCGENGEFHTFCFDGPIFNKPIDFTIGEKIYREYDMPKQGDDEKSGKIGFWFCDLLPL